MTNLNATQNPMPDLLATGRKSIFQHMLHEAEFITYSNGVHGECLLFWKRVDEGHNGVMDYLFDPTEPQNGWWRRGFNSLQAHLDSPTYQGKLIWSREPIHTNKV